MKDTRTPAQVAEDERRKVHIAMGCCSPANDRYPCGFDPQRDDEWHLDIDRALAAARLAQHDQDHGCATFAVPCYVADRLRREYEALAKGEEAGG